MRGTKLKLYYLEKILFEKTDEEHGLTVPELIDLLEHHDIKAERKSIYDDIKTLREVGFDIEKRSNGETVTYHHTKRLFSLPELKLLVDVIVSSRIITEKQSRELVAKLEKLGSMPQAKQLQRDVILQDRPKTISESSFENIGILTEAIKSGKKISFEYYKWNHAKKLIKSENGDKNNISPSFMHFSNDNYYLIAYDEEADKIKHYRIDKMRNIIIQKEKFIVRDELNTHKKKVEYSNQLSGMMSGELKRIRLECAEENLGVVIDMVGAAKLTILPRKNSNGKYECFFDYQFNRHFMGWLFGVSDIIRLIGSQECVDEYRNYMLEKINELN